MNIEFPGGGTVIIDTNNYFREVIEGLQREGRVIEELDGVAVCFRVGELATAPHRCFHGELKMSPYHNPTSSRLRLVVNSKYSPARLLIRF